MVGAATKPSETSGVTLKPEAASAGAGNPSAKVVKTAEVAASERSMGPL